MQKTVSEEIEIYRFDSGQAGPALTITGAVHGNEPCGPKALRRLIDLLESGEIEITQGSLTLIPVCNPRAYEQNVRFVEYNLNRSMYPRAEDEIEHYEDRLRSVLCPVLEKTDYLLDLHSCTAPSDPFLIVDGDLTSPDYRRFVDAAGTGYVLWGWSEAVGQSETPEDPSHAQGMGEYARLHGAHALTIECGNHDHPRGADFAFQAALGVIEAVGVAVISETVKPDDVFEKEKKVIRFKSVTFKQQEGRFFQDWVNLHPVQKGTPVAEEEGGQVFTMPEDGFLIMPKENVKIGEEWFYVGVEEEFLAS